MPYTDFFIIGNGFDRAHGMPTGYGDFKRWLIENYRFDVIHEQQSAYPIQKEDDYLLWRTCQGTGTHLSGDRYLTAKKNEGISPHFRISF